MLKKRGVKRKSGLNSCDDSEGEVVLKPPDMVDEMMTHPGAIRIVGWLKHVPKGREESKTARGWDPRTHEQTARDWDPRTHEERA